MNGWVGKILRVDLTSKTHKTEELDPDLARDFIGGQGIASKILYDEVDPKIDALSPENKLIFVTCPLTGTGALSSSRCWVVAKSPLTGAIGFSTFGGYFGSELKYAGYDLVIIEGKSKDPVYLWIDDDRIEIRAAGSVWGKRVGETDDLIREEVTDGDPIKGVDVHIASIGPAGENRVLMASVMADKTRAAGRCGLGAVMGSKNLKAVAVRGTNGITIADHKKFKEVVAAAFKRVTTHPVGGNIFPAFGSAGLVEYFNEVGLFPNRNFQRIPFEGAKNISGQIVAEKFLIRKKACSGCPLSCGGPVNVTEHPFETRGGERPEYETYGMVGGSCGIDNPSAIIKINALCNELGMDTMDIGATFACAMEMYEKEILSQEDLGFRSLTLRFGDAETMVRLVEDTAYRKRFGNILAEGGYRLAERYGHPELFMGVKKMGCSAYDPRNVHGMGLAYATSTRGACHNRAYTVAPEILGLPEKADPLIEEGKAPMVKYMQDLAASLMDAAGICLFSIAGGHTVEDMLAQLEAATGAGYTFPECLKIGERIWNVQRLFNLKAGLTSADDNLPRRFLEEPAPGGPGKGLVVNLNKMLKEYYELRGWDKNGVPTPAKLAELGLK